MLSYWTYKSMILASTIFELITYWIQRQEHFSLNSLPRFRKNTTKYGQEQYLEQHLGGI